MVTFGLQLNKMLGTENVRVYYTSPSMVIN